jgi:hypothetical protein
MAKRKLASQHWLNLNRDTGAYEIDADGGHPESVGLLIGALLDHPRKKGTTDQHTKFSVRIEEDSPWESRVEIHELAQATWDFPPNWITEPEEAARWLLRRRRIGQGRRFARSGTDGIAKRTQHAKFTFESDEAIRRALTFWAGKRGPHAPFAMQRFQRPGWDGVPGNEPTMQARFAEEALTLEFAAPAVAHATIGFDQDLILAGGQPTQQRPSRAYLYKVWWEGGVTVKAWTDWARSYTHAGVDYLPNVVEHKSSTEVLGNVGANEWELLVYDHDGNPLRAFGRLAIERRLLVEIRECDPAIADTATLIFSGEIKSAPNVGRIYTARAALFGGALKHMIPQHYCQQGCNNTLGDDLCAVDIEALKVPGAVAVINGTTIDVTCGSAEAADYYALGFAVFGAGDDLEVRYVVRSEPIVGGQRLTLHRPLWSSIVTTAVDLYPGCDQQYEGGCARYNNQGRYFGSPWKPAQIDSVDSGFKMKTGK